MKIALRILITALIFWLIFRAIDGSQVLALMAALEWPWVALALVAQLASVSMAAWRWQWVMQAQKFGLSAGFYQRSYFKGMFFNQGLPTSIGGDALRVLDVARCGFRKRDSFVGVLSDRLIGLWALMLLNAVALLFSLKGLPEGLLTIVWALVSMGSLGFIALFFIYRWSFLDSHVVLRQIVKLSKAVSVSFSHQALRVFIGSLLVHLFAMVAFFALGNAVGMDASLLTYLAIVPPAILLTVVPISLAGWGVREGALVGLFTLIGHDKVAVLAMSILYGVSLVVVSLPGLLVYLLEKDQQKEVQE